MSIQNDAAKTDGKVSFGRDQRKMIHLPKTNHPPEHWTGSTCLYNSSAEERFRP